MIKVHGIEDWQLGNQMYVYAFARILAEELNLKLECISIDGFPKTKDIIDGEVYNNPIIEFRKQGQQLEIFKKLIKEKPKCMIDICGNLQHYSYYKDYKNKIKEWFRLEESIQPYFVPTKNDLVIHLRLGDYMVNNWQLPLSYVENLIKTIPHDNVYICTGIGRQEHYTSELKQRTEKYLDFVVKKCGVKISQGDKLQDMKMMFMANKIAISPSTYSWWGAWLSNAEELYFPICKNGYWANGRFEYLDGHWGRQGIDLTIDNEDRILFKEIE